MLTYDLSGSSHLFEALYTAIKNDIISGKIKAGERLPSKRSLSEHLNISKVTVENAYAQLKAEGYIYSIEKKGYFADKAEALPTALKPPLPALREDNFSYTADLTGANAHTSTFPFSTWIKLMRETVLDFEKELVSILPPQGALPLRNSISEYLYKFRGISASAENIIIGAGTEYLYTLLVQILGRSIKYAVEDPGYEKVALVIRSNGAECIGISLDKNGVRIKSLYNSGAGVIHISPAHHFPLGIVTPAPRRSELLKWAQGGSRYIIEDDYDSEFRMTGKPIPPLKATDKGDCVIYINTFSKSLCPSLRISYMVLPDKLLEIYKTNLGYCSCTVSSFEQYTLSRFISGGYFEKHLSRMKKHYKALRDYTISAVKNSAIAKYTSIYEENSGLHFILEVSTKLSDAELTKEAKNKGLLIKSLSDYSFSHKEKSTHRFIFNYSGCDKIQIDDAIQILEELICK